MIDRVIELRQEIKDLIQEILGLEEERVILERELSGLEQALTDKNREDLESIARGNAWVKRVIQYTRKHPRDLHPSQWLDVPLGGPYLGGIEKREHHRKVILKIMP